MGEFDRGSYLARAGYDIRVTSRCRLEDLERGAHVPLAELAELPIIRGLCGKHDRDPAFVDTVGPAAGDLTLGTLQFGEDHRGAVWLDRLNNAFWLCAYGLHRSGAADDAFPYFRKLLAAGRIYPTNADRVLLDRDRASRLIDAIPHDADELRARALAARGREVSGHIGGAGVRLVVIEVAGIREAHVAISLMPPNTALTQALLLALCPSANVWGAWRPEASLPTGPIDIGGGEFAYSCLLD